VGGKIGGAYFISIAKRVQLDYADPNHGGLTM
jgi:hypothetical protein